MSSSVTMDQMRAWGQQVRDLKAAGAWNKEAFLALYREVAEASAGNPDITDALLSDAEPVWLAPDDQNGSRA